MWAGWDMVCGQGGTCCCVAFLLCWFCHDMLVDARPDGGWGAAGV